MINKIDLHGIKHQEVQRKLDSFLGKHMMGNRDYVTIVTGNSKRMREVADELNIDYNRLSHFVKIGKVNVFRLSLRGRPRFLPEHVDQVKELIKNGDV